MRAPWSSTVCEIVVLRAGSDQIGGSAERLHVEHSREPARLDQ